MEGTVEDHVYYGSNVTRIKKDEEYTVYQMKDATGEGTMTCYKVFSGIDLIYNDFHMESCFSEFQPKVDMIGIDHCREGRIEWEFQDSTYMYIEEGDMQINTRNNHRLSFGFPLGHYQGITIAIYINQVEEMLPHILDDFSINLRELCEKLCEGKRTFIMRADDAVQHIFSELYTVPDKIKKQYFKLKVLELLLFLSAVDVIENVEERPYFSKKQVETVKAIKRYMTKHVDRHFTLNDLSLKFDIPLTSLKQCFKGVYGMSVYAYIRSYRIHAAALMLSQTNESVTTIAGKVGYNNPSKFAAAFKDIMKVLPSEYQKHFS